MKKFTSWTSTCIKPDYKKPQKKDKITELMDLDNLLEEEDYPVSF